MKDTKYPVDRETAARFGILVADVMDTYAKNPSALTPDFPADYSLATQWDVIGYLVGKDTDFGKPILDIPNRHVFYGVIARSKSQSDQYIVVIRGTKGFIEWLVDAQMSLVQFDTKGTSRVENGFYSVYDSMVMLDKNMTLASSRTPAWEAIRDALAKSGYGQKTKLTVIGHSLGAAIATYLTYDLCTKGGLRDSVVGCFFACPRPGDVAFADTFDDSVGSYIVYDYSRDVIPNLPPHYPPLPTLWPPIVPTIPPMVGNSFIGLSNTYELDSSNSQAVILDNVKANHHVLCYAAMLYYKAQPDLATWWKLLSRDGDFPFCIIGPRGHL